MEEINNQNINDEQTNSKSYSQEQKVSLPERKNKSLLWIIAFIFLLIIVGAGLAYFFYFKYDMPQSSENQPVVKSEPPVEEIYQEQNEEIGNDIIENTNEVDNEFVFNFDKSCNYTASTIKPKSNYTGVAFDYSDENKNCPGFVIFSKNFEVEGMNYWDSIVLDDINGETTPHFFLNTEEYEHIIKLEENIFQIVGYGSYECSPDISSQLVYVLPESSSYKYIVFYLGWSNFDEDDFADICEPKEEVIKEKINSILNKNHQEIEKNFDMALDILDSAELIKENVELSDDEDTGSSKTGLIKGSLSYPGGRIPSLKVCAVSKNDDKEYCTNENIEGEEFIYKIGYKLEVPEGKYSIYATGGSGDLSNTRAYYTEKEKCEIENNCVIKMNSSDINRCNLVCGEISTLPVEIVITVDEIYFDASPSDWYNNN